LPNASLGSKLSRFHNAEDPAEEEFTRSLLKATSDGFVNAIDRCWGD
jgi:hypothetical protein